MAAEAGTRRGSDRGTASRLARRGDPPASARPRGPPARLGCRRPGGIQPDQLRRQHLRGPHAGGRAVRRVQPRLRDLRVRAQRIARPGHRPADGQVQRHRRCRPGGAPWPGCTGTADQVGLCIGACVLVAAAVLHGAARAVIPRPRAYAAGADAAGQLAVFVLRARARQPGLPQRHDLGGDAVPRPVPAEEDRARRRLLVRLRLGRRRRASPPPSGPWQARVMRPGRPEPGRGCRGTRDLGPRYLLEGTRPASPTSYAAMASASCWAWPRSAPCRLPTRCSGP